MTRITDRQMASESGRHHATPARAGDPYGMWDVSWLPGRELTRNQVITAMILTDYVEQSPADLGNWDGQRWMRVEDWAAELRLTAWDAADRIRGVSR